MDPSTDRFSSRARARVSAVLQAAKELVTTEDAMKTLGWTVEGTVQSGGNTLITATKDTRSLALSVASGEGQTTVTIGIGNKD